MLSFMQERLRKETGIENDKIDRVGDLFYGLLEQLTYPCCMGVEEVYEECWSE